MSLLNGDENMNEYVYYQIFEFATVLFETFIVHQYISAFFEQKRRTIIIFIGYAIFCLGLIILSLGFRELPVLAAYTAFGVFVLISLFYKSEIASRLFSVAFFVMVAMVSDGICSSIIEMTGQKNISDVMVYGLPRVLFVVIAKLVQIFIVKIINLTAKWKQDKKAAVEIKRVIPLLICQIASVLLTYQIIATGLYVNKYFGLPIFSAALSILYINIIIFWYFDNIKAAFEYKARNEAAEMKLEIQKQYYEMMETDHKETDALWHDMKKQIDYIKMLIETGQYDNAKQYSTEIENQILSVSRIVKTPHPIISALLTVERRKADRNNINVKFDVDISPEIKVLSSDLGIIIGNIFENAIEACLQIDDINERYIKFTICQKNNMALIEMENAYINSENKTVRSGRHGYGLKNVRKIVINKYGGSVEVKPMENVYKIIIIIP